ncbi:MAG: exodeoxyribonuclease V subunit gamma [Trueperaceae bacterium]|nr:exodeoxyribonuclease V subunit gamma [Trueperaceae bacterium]
MLTLVHGPFHPGLEDALVADLQALGAGDPLRPLVVTAPSRLLLDRLKARALHAFPHGLVGVEFLPYAALAHRLCPAGGRVEDSLLLRIAVVRTLRERLAGQKHLGPLRDYPGLVDVLYGALRDLQDALVDPVAAVAAIAEGEYAGRDAEVLAEMFLLQLCCRETLERESLRDDAGVFLGAANAAAGHAWLQRCHGVLVYGFYDMTGVQEELLSALTRVSDVRCYVPWVKDDPAWAFAEPFALRLHGRASVCRPLAAATRRPPRVRLFHASGMADEVWKIAKDILRLVESEQVPWDHIGVVTRSLAGGYGAAFRTAFADHAIPVQGAAVRSLSEHPLAKAVSQWIGLEEDGFSRRAVLELVTSPYFKGEPGRADLWDLLSRRLAIRGGRAGWRRLERACATDILVQGRDPEDPRAITIPAAEAARCHERVQRLLDATGSPAVTAPWTEWVARTRTAIATLFAVPPDDVAAADAWRGIHAVLDRLTACARVGGEVDHRFFVEVFRREVAGAASSIGPDVPTGVHLLDAMAARGLSFPVLFVAGLNEGVFPRAIHEEPFLRDRLRRRLNEVPGGALAEKLRGFDEERLLFRLLEDAAERELVLSWQRSDEDGRMLIPSLVLQSWRTQAERGAIACEAVPLGVRKRLQTVPWLHLTPREAGMLLPLFGRSARPAIGAGGGIDYTRAARAMRAMDEFGPLTGWDGQVGSVGAWWEDRARRGLSPTALECFSRCPFQFFGKHVLRLEALPEPESVGELSAADQGTLVHAVLENLSRRGVDHGDRLAAVFAEVAEQAFAAFEADNPVGYPLLWEARRRFLRAGLERYVREDAARAAGDGYLPRFVEAGGAAEIVAGTERVRVSGRMDRIEVRDEGDVVRFRVRDFKTGRVPYASERALLTQIERGRRLQLPAYLSMGAAFLAARYPERKIVATGAVYEYLGLDDEVRREFGVPGDFWQSPEAERTLATVAWFVALIRDGKFFLHPSHDSFGHCRHCDFSGLCRREHLPSRARAEADATARDFHERVGP